MKRNHELSLNEISTSPVKDVFGYVSNEFGDPCFKLTRIEFADGRTADVEGEHDMPYLCDCGDIVTLPETPDE